MDELLQHPAVQAGMAPLVMALTVAAALWRTRLAWLAVAAAYATAVALSVGFALQPLTAGRKVTLLIVLAALLGTVLDTSRLPPRRLVPVLAIVGGLLAWWAMASVLGQRDWNEHAWIALGLFMFVAAHAGNFTLLGVTKPLTLTFERFRCAPHPFTKKDRCGGNAVGKIKRSDFGMKYGIPAMSDEVALNVSFEGDRD